MQPKVAIVVGKCGKTKNSFGIRFEEKMKDSWLGDWSFPIKDKTADKEGYGKTELQGSFAFGDEFPGCPHCGSHSFYLCSCGKLACYDGESRKVTCPTCGATAELGGNVNKMNAGSDR